MFEVAHILVAIIVIFTVLGQSETRPNSDFVLGGSRSKRSAKNCNSCIDRKGRNCDGYIERFEQTKYWVPTWASFKDDNGSTFADAKEKCHLFHLIIAELVTKEKNAKDLKRAIHTSGFEVYWLVMKIQTETKPVAVDKNEDFKDSTHLETKLAYICEFPQDDECIKAMNDDDDNEGFYEIVEDVQDDREKHTETVPIPLPTTKSSATFPDLDKNEGRIMGVPTNYIPKPRLEPGNYIPKPVLEPEGVSTSTTELTTKKSRKCKSLLYGNRLAVQF